MERNKAIKKERNKERTIEKKEQKKKKGRYE